jgi:transposase
MESHFGHAIFFDFRTLDVMKEGVMTLYPNPHQNGKSISKGMHIKHQAQTRVTCFLPPLQCLCFAPAEDFAYCRIGLEPIRKLLESNESDVIPCQALDSAGERPMWKPEHRRAADRTGLRYPSDLSDAEWLIVEPMIPPAKRGGRRRSVNVREVLNGIFYVLWTGCQWKALPKDLPPKSTVHDYLELWNWDGTLERIHHELYMAVREQEGREPSPTVAIIDSQTAKGSQKGGLGSILRATTRARRSRVASGTSWSTRWASC